jgi:uncharacterized phage protein (TIGR01671 family)
MKKIKFRVWTGSQMLNTDNLSSDIYINSEGVVSEYDYNYGEPMFWEREDYIVMQDTGLKDKNGKEIYEGDILEWRDKYSITRMEVIFRNGEFVFFSKWSINKKFCDEVLEIIGNIYENPELLEKGNENRI